MTYSDLVSALKAYLIIEDDGSDPTSAFLAALPRIIEGAELRCFRDVDFLAARASVTSTLSAATLTAPADWLIGRDIFVTGIGRLLRRDETFLNEYWPDRTAIGKPKYWTETTAGTLLFAATPDMSYSARLTYTSRLPGLSAGVPTTWLSTHAPDLLLKACMVEGAGYLKNFGAQSDDPKMAMSWESAYQAAKAAAMREEARRKGEPATDAASPTAPPA